VGLGARLCRTALKRVRRELREPEPRIGRCGETSYAAQVPAGSNEYRSRQQRSVPDGQHLDPVWTLCVTLDPTVLQLRLATTRAKPKKALGKSVRIRKNTRGAPSDFMADRSDLSKFPNVLKLEIAIQDT
jgi:hypothetical protein